MGTGVSLFFMAVGAILTFALDTNAEGVNLDAIGIILMLVGLGGLLFSLLVLGDWHPGRRAGYVDDDVVVRRDPVVVDEDPAFTRRTVTRRSYR